MSHYGVMVYITYYILDNKLIINETRVYMVNNSKSTVVFELEVCRQYTDINSYCIVPLYRSVVVQQYVQELLMALLTVVVVIPS